jgi:putative (di)nucleoside polyphosphate hydrolase
MVGVSGKSRTNPNISLDDWLADPLIQLIMHADKVDPTHIRQLYRRLLDHYADPARTPTAGYLAMDAEQSREFRAGVGIMLLNRHDRVFVGRRARTPGEEAWQMPQGGIDDGEEPVAAALRELREEVGTDLVEVLAESNVWLRYELPPDLVGKAWKGRWRGQQQKWFAMRFLGCDTDINIATEHPEFSGWRWVSAAELPNLIVSFKRQVYRDVLREFRHIALIGPVGEETENPERHRRPRP